MEEGIVFSVCDESNGHSSSENQEKIYEKMTQLNTILNDLFQQWAKNLSQIRELAVSVIQSTLPSSSDQPISNISQLLSTFQTGAILHCGSFNSFFSLIHFQSFLQIWINITTINYVWNMN